VDEDLDVAVARHQRLSKRHPRIRQYSPGGVEIDAAKRDVIASTGMPT
jgi:hypothetical protein